MRTAKRTIYEGDVSVCAHRVSYWFDTHGVEITPELETLLDEHAEYRAKECIIEGYVSGELVFFDDESGVDFSGWWSIERE